MFIFKKFPFPQKVFLAAFVLFFLSTTAGQASVVHLLSGEIIKGEIVARDNELIRIDSGMGFPVTYFLDEIDTIDSIPVAPRMEEIKPLIIDQLRFESLPPEKDPGIESKPADAPAVVEPPAVIEPAKAVESKEPVAMPEEQEVPIKTSTTKDVATLEGIELFKEQPSPAEIKPREAPPQAIKVQPEKKLEIPGKRPIGDAAKEKVLNLVAKTSEYIKLQLQSFEETKSRFQEKLPFIKERLGNIPVKVRRDLLALLAAFFAAVYVVVCLPLTLIAIKLKKKHPWIIWVPFAQIFYFVAMAGRRLWWAVFLFVPVLSVIFFILFFMDILKALKRSRFLIIPLILPGANIVALWYLALSRAPAVPKVTLRPDV